MTPTALDSAASPDRVALYERDFSDDPHAAYTRMRQAHGPLVPVELSPGIPATLVIGYRQARTILHDPQRFPADPSTWQKQIPVDCPVRPMLEYRPNALRSGPKEHIRYRAANTAAIDATDQHALHRLVETICAEALAELQPAGRVDLLTEYARKVASRTLNGLLGCPHGPGTRIAGGMAAIFNASDPASAARGNEVLAQAVAELVALRQQHPGDDITTRLLAHPAHLDDTEMAHQLVTLYGAGIEPLANLIANTILRILTDPRFAAALHAGRTTVRAALDHVLYRDPPMANYCASYPPYPADVDGVLLPAHQPVLISMTGCNNDPELTAGMDPDAITGNRAHLAWSTGPHTCPARSHAYLIAETAITHLLDAQPEIDLAVPVSELRWRPGPFHRALESLPVTLTA
ncbi:cytochrome P450 [Streptomyces shenzhenensis]|uniref:cytochrome P450 n=1 Tax=Streptomyces shenzhenensis TaxID=943815 RepID=UPI00340A5F38